jgi:hypothetical protein
MSRRFTKKRVVAAVSVVAALAMAATAFAYFTTTGSGSGSASVGTSSDITLTGTTSGTLYPGAYETVSLSANNHSPGNQKLGTITLSGVKACPSGSTWDATLNSNAGGCTNSATEVTGCETSSGVSSNDTSKNFYMAPVIENQDLPSGNGTTLTNASATLVMNDLSTSQDSCKSANLYLILSAAQSS